MFGMFKTLCIFTRANTTPEFRACRHPPLFCTLQSSSFDRSRSSQRWIHAKRRTVPSRSQRVRIHKAKHHARRARDTRAMPPDRRPQQHMPSDEISMRTKKGRALKLRLAARAHAQTHCTRFAMAVLHAANTQRARAGDQLKICGQARLLPALSDSLAPRRDRSA